MELYPIFATGIKAFCSDMIIDPYSLEEVYFMSIAGYQTTVKGIIANLLENYGLSIEVKGEEYYLTRIKMAGTKHRSKNFPLVLCMRLCSRDWHCQKMRKTSRTVFIFLQRKDARKIIRVTMTIKTN